VQETLNMPRIGRTGKVAAIAVAGVAAIGGLSAAVALPVVSELSGGHSAVETVPPESASETGVEHATAGGNPATPSDVGVQGGGNEQGGGSEAADVEAAGSRLDGLETAAGNVTNDTASAVIETLIATEPGPGFGAAVAAVASDGHANVPTNVPATPEQASNGLSHKP
jgi:hypothetical protein